jgi:ribonuclease T2
VKLPRSNLSKVALATALIGGLIAWFSMHEAGVSPPVDAQDRRDAKAAAARRPAARAANAFDFYLLALTVHPAFCADGHESSPECRAQVQRPLVIHGLWPERLEPRTYPHDCPAPELHLDAALKLELADFMPGVSAGLHEHEWREHGGCSSLDDDEYFRSALELARVLDAALGAKLTTLSGEETSAAELRATADLFRPGLGVTFTLHCRTLSDAPRVLRGHPYLMEVRQCVDNDGPHGAPGTLLDCAAVNRRDQGCGAAFHIAELHR